MSEPTVLAEGLRFPEGPIAMPDSASTRFMMPYPRSSRSESARSTWKTAGVRGPCVASDMKHRVPLILP